MMFAADKLGDKTTQVLPHYIQKLPPEVFSKKVVLRNFTKFPGKHLCYSLRTTTSAN